MALPDPFSPSQAGMDLGMGAQLQQQVMAQVLEKRKKALIGNDLPASSFGALALGPGMSVPGAGNTGGMALQALMGAGANGG
jgi:hypothetical protein